MPNRKLKRHLNIGFRWLTILIICTVTVYLFPRGGSFQYEYQKGMQWRYETLYAPFSFPIHKTEEELQQEREKSMKSNSLFSNATPRPEAIKWKSSARLSILSITRKTMRNWENLQKNWNPFTRPAFCNFRRA